MEALRSSRGLRQTSQDFAPAGVSGRAALVGLAARTAPVWGWPRLCCAGAALATALPALKLCPGAAFRLCLCLPQVLVGWTRQRCSAFGRLGLHSGVGALTLRVGARCTCGSLGLLSQSAPAPRGLLPSPGAPVCGAVLRHRSPPAHPGRLWPLFCVALQVW